MNAIYLPPVEKFKAEEIKLLFQRHLWKFWARKEFLSCSRDAVWKPHLWASVGFWPPHPSHVQLRCMGLLCEYLLTPTHPLKLSASPPGLLSVPLLSRHRRERESAHLGLWYLLIVALEKPPPIKSYPANTGELDRARTSRWPLNSDSLISRPSFSCLH